MKDRLNTYPNYQQYCYDQHPACRISQKHENPHVYVVDIGIADPATAIVHPDVVGAVV